MRKSLDSKVPERVLHIHHTPRGPEHVDVELRPILDEQGRVVAFVERLTSVTLASAQPQEQGLVGRAAAFKAAVASLQRAAPAQIPVLLQGESGPARSCSPARCTWEAPSQRAAGGGGLYRVDRIVVRERVVRL
jgi:DNA-binding NtrC family response regulator